jgi:cytochrome c biogenesis protein CcmG/thiol:disulfide interchange protein DsbE
MAIKEETKPQETPIGPHWGQILVWVVIIFILGVAALQLIKQSQGGVKVGDEVPDFILTTFNGEDYQLSELRGKVVVVNLWASWCTPCEQEAAELQAAWEHYKGSGEVIFLGAAYSDTDVEAAKYMEMFGITYPSGHDLGTKLYRTFNASGVPETYIIDRNGKLTYAKIGPFNSLEEIILAIDGVLEQ